MHLQSYLFFDGKCEEAINFYKSALGAKVNMMMRYKESPEPTQGKVDPNKIMHASLQIGKSDLMMSDGHCTGQPTFKGFAQSIGTTDPSEAERIFKALSEGGQVQMPMTKTFFSPAFGMVTDRFGVMWMVIVDRD